MVQRPGRRRATIQTRLQTLAEFSVLDTEYYTKGSESIEISTIKQAILWLIGPHEAGYRKSRD